MPGFTQDLSVSARAQRSIEVELLGVTAQLVQAIGLDAARIPALEVTKRAAPPQAQCLAGQVRSAFRFAQRQDLSGPAHQALEPQRVDLVAWDDQAIALGHGLDDIGPQHPPETHHTARHHLGPRDRGTLAPKGIGQLLGADDLARSQRQCGEYDPIPWRQPSRVSADGQWAEHADATTAHHSTVRR